jgi:coatomer subunit beta
VEQVIHMTIQGENPPVVMHIIRFVLPSRNHALKKLSLLYLEAVEKVDKSGKLKPEMILVW